MKGSASNGSSSLASQGSPPKEPVLERKEKVSGEEK